MDHVREGYFSLVFLLHPDDSARQQPTRTRSQPLGLDGLCPKATRIVRGTNQHAELTTRFAKQALLCSEHKIATVLIIPEDLGGHQQQDHLHSGRCRNFKPWKAWMTHTVALASRASSGTQNKVTLQESFRTSHPFPCCFTGGGGHRYSKFTTGSQILSNEALFQRRVPVRHSMTSMRLQKMARATFSQVTVLAAFSGGSVSTASNQHSSSG